MFEDLKQAIKSNDNQEPPDMSNWWGLISDLEKLTPDVMLRKGWMGYVKKAARILFYRDVCDDLSIVSTKNLTSGQLWEIHKWLNDEDCCIEHCASVTQWYNENAARIVEYAKIVKVKKLKADKAKRRNSKVLF